MTFKNHYVSPHNQSDYFFNRSEPASRYSVEANNRFVRTIKSSVKAINQSEEPINRSEEPINHPEEAINQLEEAIKYNLLYNRTLQPFHKLTNPMLQLGMMPYRVEKMSRTCNSYPRVQKPNGF